MNGAANLIRAIGSLWPILILIVIVWFRKPIGHAFSKLSEGLRLSRVKAGPFEAEFWKEAFETQKAISDAVDETRPEDLQSLAWRYGAQAETDPAAAILAAHTEVEDALRQKLAAPGATLDPAQGVYAPGLARLALSRGLISAKVVPAVEGLTALRNLATHNHGDDVTPKNARDYLDLADGVLYALSVPPRQAE